MAEVALPFLGMVLRKGREEKTPPHRIFYLTQKMLLTVLYRGITNAEVTEMAKSGLTAISHFSMLADNGYATYAISKQAMKDLQVAKLPQVPTGEFSVAVVQIMGYAYLYEGTDELVIDPLSAVLSLTPEELNDPRIEGTVEEIMEEFIYGRS